MKAVLKSPTIYQAYQKFGGFFDARVKVIEEYLSVLAGQRIVDIGCGPGHIVGHLPTGIDYLGFDIDETYISHATKAFGDRGRFFCRYFDAAAAREFTGADVVMMNGVLHHVPDEELKTILTNARDVLKEDGVLLTLDGCYCEKQSRFARWMLDNDRGMFVRDRGGYERVLGGVFPRVELVVRDDYTLIPYTWAVGISRKSDAGNQINLSQYG